MPYSKIFIDDRLVEWGDQIFEPPLKRPHKPPPTTPLWLIAYVSWLAVEDAKKGRLIREQISRTVQKAPEVMVHLPKPQEKTGKGMASIRKHLEYISRNAKVHTETELGEIISSRDDLEEIMQFWEFGPSGAPIPQESDQRLAKHVLFSMPSGTPALEVLDSVRHLLQEEVAGRNAYIFSLHEDTNNPHVHVWIKRAPIEGGPQFELRKKDLARWRERFASHLRDRGIEANATPRRTRGVIKDSLPLEVFHMQQKKLETNFKQRTLTKALYEYHRPQIEAWRQMGQLLDTSNEISDGKMAAQIDHFIQDSFARNKGYGVAKDTPFQNLVAHEDYLAMKRSENDSPAATPATLKNKPPKLKRKL